MKTMTLSELFVTFDSSAEGLSDADVKQRHLQHGFNLLSQIPTRPWYLKLTAQFTHFFALLLWLAAGISFTIAWIDPPSHMLSIGWAIVIVIVLNGVFGFYQEYRTEKSLQALRNMLPLKVRVRRQGSEGEVLASDLVPGDIVLLSEGDKVPADLYLIVASDVWVNESTLSGESELVSADAVGSDHSKNILYSGTYVVKGEAQGLVYATGKESRYGTIAVLTQSVDSGVSHLQKEIAHISKLIALTSVVIAGSLILLSGFGDNELWKTFLFSLGVLVALIPEGLLPTVTLALAFGAQRMASKGFLVNGLSVIENLGAVTVIATDKTGTITQNKMEVAAWDEDEKHPPSQELLNAALLCNRSDGSNGDPVEQALYTFALTYTDVAQRRSEYPIVSEYPFDYHLKRMSTVHSFNGGFSIFSKGAPEVILGLCDEVITAEGKKPINESEHQKLIDKHDALAALGYRVIGFASRECTTLPTSREEAEEGLSFIGFIAMVDPLRDDILESVGLCHKAGIRVVMITGDHPLTAGAIGMSAGIITLITEVTTGEQLDALPPAAIKRLLHKNHVFARVSPEQKLTLITLLKEMGETVAVTGDGVNDAPALKRADVGIAMGSGTDVAKQSADAVLMDDHFATIVKGIEEGRAVYENIRRFITYMLASNLPEAVPYVLFFAFGLPLALPVPLVLAIDLGTDIIPGMALGAELPNKGLMNLPPRNRKDHILTLGVYGRAFGFLGLLSAAMSMGLFWFYLTAHGWRGESLSLDNPLYLEAVTLTFAAIVFAQIGNGLSCRSQRDSLFTIGFWSNRYYWGGVVFEIGLLVVLIFVTPLSSVFGTHPFDPIYWWAVVAVMVIILAAEEIRKGIIRFIRR
ncbi:MAG: cation-transporting P-type ATPase [Sulfuricurvum sp.]|uniref:cation-translocating P-type ATPase n=1 Tax=Sulfuricurvum sp. TaxID=2025608 RepID=UPI002737082F|nr:cation-transporting P-type ATPase [Sulfuricurvum sp.]MDP2850794.1 cation-transporting P-type ATPase [Sulfuricurvum sp.]